MGFGSLVRQVTGYIKTDKGRVPDPDLCLSAHNVDDFFSGYPYIVEWDWTKVGALSSYTRQHDEMMLWCDHNCTDKFDTRVHRVVRDDYQGWVFNDIGGLDHSFWAFKNERDALMFSLKWVS